MPPSPTLLMPSGLSGLGASSVSSTSTAGISRSGRQQVIGEGDAQRLAALVVDEFLVQRAAEPLREAADQLPLDQHRVDRPADVVGEQKALDGRLAGLASTRTTPICTP